MCPAPALPTPPYRELLDALAEGVVWHGPDGTVLDANSAAGPILGLSREELLGRSSMDPRWQVIHEDGSPWPGDEHPSMLALRTGKPQRGKVMGVLAPGHGRRWISVHAMPLFNGGQPRPTGVVASFVDITVQIILRNRLLDATRELGELYDHAPCGYHQLDPDGRYLRVNDTELAWLDASRAQVLGRLGLQDFLSEESRLTFAPHFQALAQGQAVRALELEMVSTHGERRRIRYSAQPVLDPAGQWLGVRGVADDITEQHRTWLNLQRVSAEQAALLDNALVGILRVQGRTIVWKNRALDHLLGYDGDELLGRDDSPLHPDAEAQARFIELSEAALQAGRPFRSLQALRRKDGEIVWVDLHACRLMPHEDEAIWFLTDVSAQRREASLRQALAERSAELLALRAELAALRAAPGSDTPAATLG